MNKKYIEIELDALENMLKILDMHKEHSFEDEEKFKEDVILTKQLLDKILANINN